MSLSSEFERTIVDFDLPGLAKPFQGMEFVLPHYGGYSIANLPATVAGLLGVELEGVTPQLPRRAWDYLVPGARRIVLVILDAVGYRPFRRLLETGDTVFGRLAREGTFVPLTSVFPSTTMTAMSSLWTGRTPGQHGFLGRRLLLSNPGVLADMIRLTLATHGRPGALLEWGWQPEGFLPVPDLAQELAVHGVGTVAHLYAPFSAGGLARLFLRNVASIRGYVNLSDMWINVRDSLVEHPQDRQYVHAYWHSTDDVAHRYGPEDERFRAALRQIARSFDQDFMRALPSEAREGTVLVVTADHGQIGTPPERAIQLADHPALGEMLLVPPAAEPRASVLYVRRGQAEAVRDYVAEHLAGQFILLDSDDALAAGLFGSGEISTESRARLGDLLLLARDDGQLVPDSGTTIYRGEHGSLRREEMLVPLLMVRLDG